jgi:tetratricopeptide (TPR) repeat protein
MFFIDLAPPGGTPGERTQQMFCHGACLDRALHPQFPRHPDLEDDEPETTAPATGSQDAPTGAGEPLADADAVQRAGDRGVILATSQLLAGGDLTLDQRLQTLKRRALARYRSEHFAGSADDWTRIIELDPADRTALVSRGACGYGLKDYQAGLDDLLAAETQFGPLEVGDLIWRAACRWGLDDVAGARRDLKAAATLDPDNLTIWRWRVYISQAGNDDPQTALQEITLAMGALPAEANHYLQKAGVLETLGRRVEAISDLDAALGLEPDRLDLRRYRAELKEAADDVEGAVADRAAIVAMEPGNIGDQEDYVGLLRKLGLLDEALTVADGFVQAFGERAASHRMRADVLGDMGDDVRQLEALRAAWAAAPWQANYGYRVAVLLRKAGDLAGACEALQSLNTQYFNPAVGRELFEVLSALGRFKDALDVAGSIVAAHPESAEAYRRRAQALAALGRNEDARADLDTAAGLDAAGPEEG